MYNSCWIYFEQKSIRGIDNVFIFIYWSDSCIIDILSCGWEDRDWERRYWLIYTHGSFLALRFGDINTRLF